MTASNGEQCISRNSPKSSPARGRSDAGAINDDLIVNARVTYAPLAVWKDSHWTCTVANFASPVQNRLG
jgi:hypothetical protein